MSDNFPALTVGVIDYGMGNIQSVRNALSRLNVHSMICQNPGDFAKCQSLILPGVGAFGRAMENLKKFRLIDPLLETLSSGDTPLLGICLGMQLLVDHSEERGSYEGLGLIPGTVKKIQVQDALRLPLIGWNTVDVQSPIPLFSKIGNKEAFYFVHSYHVECSDTYRSATCQYGGTVTAAIQKGHIFGVQFHPEKSQTNGLRLLRAFCDYSLNHRHQPMSEGVSC